MEIARLEVATQHHLDRIQETTKVNYVQYGKSTKSKKGKKFTQSGASGGNYKAVEAMEQVLYLVEKARSFHSCKTLVTDVEKADIRKYRIAKLWTWCADVVERRDTLRKLVSKENVLHIPWTFQRLPTIILMNLYTSMMMDNQCTYIWLVFFMQINI